jgi:hypothetical protein
MGEALLGILIITIPIVLLIGLAGAILYGDDSR